MGGDCAGFGKLARSLEEPLVAGSLIGAASPEEVVGGLLATPHARPEDADEVKQLREVLGDLRLVLVRRRAL